MTLSPVASQFVIPSLDLLGGRAVRLLRGRFDAVTDHGDPREALDRLQPAPGSLLHVVDLEGSRRGRPVEVAAVSALARRGLVLQVGGGVRSGDDARRWIDAGASRIVVGTAAAGERARLAAICDAAGAGRVVVAVDVREGRVRIDGWEGDARRTAAEIVRDAECLGVAGLLVTDIGCDGTLSGPALDLYRRLAGSTRLPLLASGGVGSVADLVAVARAGAAGAVVGRALLEGRFSIREAEARLADASRPVRVIPCLDVRGGRVVKGVAFRDLRDAGDPVECARRYEAEGADELVLLDVSATLEERVASRQTVSAVARSLFIPLTAGGGVRTLDDFRALLRAGADRVAVNSAALDDPSLIRRAAAEFGVQAVVVACDVRRSGQALQSPGHDDRWIVVGRSGTVPRPLDAVAWCREAERLGAGEILLTAIDRDGRQEGFDIDLLRAVTSSVRIGVIASGGAGRPEHFVAAVERGGAAAVLAASTFHDRVLAIHEVKGALASSRIPVRVPDGVAS